MLYRTTPMHDKKDLVSLASILDDDSFVLVHMTGMEQDKQAFIQAIKDGTLNYYSAHHENIRTEVNGVHAEVVGESRVAAAVFGGGRHTWRLRLQIQFISRNGKWIAGRMFASAY
ncbi:MAG: nuclear transport factor 2 family protein [Lachnospiraceae bacterium]|nr:nuclear transport factor 2 family protein [Lachnospiraceae bacterium]